METKIDFFTKCRFPTSDKLFALHDAGPLRVKDYTKVNFVLIGPKQTSHSIFLLDGVISPDKYQINLLFLFFFLLALLYSPMGIFVLANQLGCGKIKNNHINILIAFLFLFYNEKKKFLAKDKYNFTVFFYRVQLASTRTYFFVFSHYFRTVWRMVSETWPRYDIVLIYQKKAAQISRIIV